MGRKILNYFKNNTLFSSSLVIMNGSIIANVGTYLYHLLMGRMLGPENYGILESLISITYFLTVAHTAISLIIVKYISKEKNKEKKALFIKEACSMIGKWGILFLAIFLALFPFLRNLIKVSSFPYFLGLGIFSYFSIFLVIFSSVLQGTKRFGYLSLCSIFTAWTKLLIAYFLVRIGFMVGGAIAANVITTILTIILGYFMVRSYLPLNISGKIDIKESFKNIWQYTGAVFFSNLALVSFFTVDVILARYFLSPLEAGYYASLAVLGKIIFFASSAIPQVMFPLVSEKQSKNQNYHKTFWQSFLMVLGISVTISGIYFLFPKVMVNILFGNKYLESVPSLGIFAIFISLYSLCFLFANFFLCLSKTKVTNILIVFALLQIIFISLFHNSINQIIWVNISILSLLLLTLLIYYFKIARINEK